MVDIKTVEKQLKKLKFNHNGWGRSEVRELPNILLHDETIFEVVNGYYEAGFALLIATDVRVLLVDKKPLNYLTVEDLRFDMINEIDYSHRLLVARISISTGPKNLKFTSLNQPRLRKLITHVQHCMAENKTKQSEHQEDQKLHLEQINQQLQAYLLAQHQQQEKLHEQLQKSQDRSDAKDAAHEAPKVEVIKPSPQLADYLFAQSLLAQHNQGQAPVQPVVEAKVISEPGPQPPGQHSQSIQGTLAEGQPGIALPAQTSGNPVSTDMADLYAEGMQEIFGKRQSTAQIATASPVISPVSDPVISPDAPGDINPLKIAYSKLPMALRNRKFGRPSFHSHSQQNVIPPAEPPQQSFASGIR